jgi:putative toxin-antitoxin system, antitoxin component, xre family
MAATKYVGKMRTPEDTARSLRVTPSQLNTLADNHKILRLTNTHGQVGYPVFQFDRDGINPTVQQVVNTLLNGGYDPWTVGFWIYRPSRVWGGVNAIEYMSLSEEHKARVILCAETDAANLLANL